ncbi:hypothetical protein NM688_g6613 [Phlebia brevispora]|uniref:Uncharacterized protein n=1 Tax=Phlebia brevispora TaxID=194682 RepID=A0ACC1SE75_9APHY|nr:hypothetical protein NM688_g6613 [Phlebia brevispora]
MAKWYGLLFRLEIFPAGTVSDVGIGTINPCPLESRKYHYPIGQKRGRQSSPGNNVDALHIFGVRSLQAGTIMSNSVPQSTAILLHAQAMSITPSDSRCSKRQYVCISSALLIFKFVSLTSHYTTPSTVLIDLAVHTLPQSSSYVPDLLVDGAHQETFEASVACGADGSATSRCRQKRYRALQTSQARSPSERSISVYRREMHFRYTSLDDLRFDNRALRRPRHIRAIAFKSCEIQEYLDVDWKEVDNLIASFPALETLLFAFYQREDVLCVHRDVIAQKMAHLKNSIRLKYALRVKSSRHRGWVQISCADDGTITEIGPHYEDQYNGWKHLI